jgi:hypothetical protein
VKEGQKEETEKERRNERNINRKEKNMQREEKIGIKCEERS